MSKWLTGKLTGLRFGSAGTLPRRSPRADWKAPALDAALGFTLLRDGRLPAACRARALAVGAAIPAGVIVAAAIASRLLGAPGRGVSLAADAAIWAAGTVLCAALLVMRFAPKTAVTRARCEQFAVIPLRARRPQPAVKRRVAGKGEDALAALGYEAPDERAQYAIIPCRTR